MMHDQPLAVDLTEASGPTQPEIGLLPSVHGSAYPVEAVGECHVIAHRDGQVVNFIVNRALVDEKTSSQTFLNASAPTYRSGGTMSNDTTSCA